MRRIVTDDGSPSFVDERLDESYHSTTGAVEEAFEKFAVPCGLAQRALTGEVTILDVCFGLGYNTAAALDVIGEAAPRCPVIVFGLESDRAILERTREVAPPFNSYRLVREAALKLEAEQGPVKIRILLGDAKVLVHRVPVLADAVFFDPFSPAKAPDMWGAEFFTAVAAKMKQGGKLATYSCARTVRDNLRAAGFTVHDGPSIGRRGPSTVAVRI